ncbi:MAG: deoxyribonuclease IV [Thermoplasmatota archaeon]
MRLGAHVSISGGVENAPENGRQLNCDCIQLFSKNQQQWAAKPITEVSQTLFRSRVSEMGIGPNLIHGSYLLNLASPDETVWKKSVEGLTIELERAEQLGVPWVVVHPGAAKEMGPAWGVKRIVTAVRAALDATAGAGAGVLLETNAGAGSAVGRSFEELGEMLAGIHDERSGVCLDTCHVFVAGYAIHTEEGYEETFRSFDRIIGLRNLKAFHLNDALAPFGSNRDRHEHVGKGMLGLATWKRLMSDPRFADLPGYLETELDGVAADLAALRKLQKGGSGAPKAAHRAAPASAAGRGEAAGAAPNTKRSRGADVGSVKSASGGVKAAAKGKRKASE